MPEIKIKDADIIRFIEPLLKTAVDWATTLSSKRAECDDLYNRGKLGNEREGFSQYVAATVFDTIEWLKPSMVDIFTHPDFFTVSMDDSDKADKNKKLIRYQMFRQQQGSRAIREYVDTSLRYHNGILKIFFEEDYNEESETHARLTQEQAQQIDADENTQITKYNEVEEITPQGSITYFEDVKVIRRIENFRGPRLIAIPPEEFLYTPDGSEIDDFSLTCHRQSKTLDEIKRGEMTGMYRKGSVDKLLEYGSESADTTAEDEQSRRYEADDLPMPIIDVVSEGDKETQPNKKVFVDEIYTKLDIDGDGLSENVIIWKSADVVLNVLENPYGRPPFRGGRLYEVPFRFEGKPLPLMLAGDQTEMTNLRRIYTDAAASSAYGTMISTDPSFLDEWAERTVGDSILASVTTNHEFIQGSQPGESLLKGLEIVRGDYERTTGVNSLNQGLTSESMGKTATGTVALQNAGQQRQKLYATILGETLKDVVKDFMWINKTWPPTGAISILGREVTQIDPKDMDGEADVQIEVGVSPNDRIQKVQQLEGHFAKLANVIIPQGGAGIEHLLKTEQKIGKLNGLSVDDLQYSTEEVNSFKAMQQQMQQMQQQMQQMAQLLQQQGIPPQQGAQPQQGLGAPMGAPQIGR